MDLLSYFILNPYVPSVSGEICLERNKDTILKRDAQLAQSASVEVLIIHLCRSLNYCLIVVLFSSFG